MPPEERNSKKLKAELKKCLPGFIVLALIIGIFVYVIIKDGDGGLKKPNTLTKKNTNNVVMNISDSSIQDLVSLVYSETDGYSENVQQCVAELVFNRVRSNDFPNNIHDVIYQQGEFESVYTGTIVPYSSIPEDKARNIERIVNSAKTTDNIGGALFYYKPYQVTPQADAEIRTMPGVKVVENVVFMTTFPY